MVSKTVIAKKRGPAPSGKGALVGVRLQPDDLAAVDDWGAEQSDHPTRPEAIRRLIRKGLETDQVMPAAVSSAKLPSRRTWRT